MSLKDIEKLKEKVDKDPNSKLFVPLAEEYRKEGMLDEAIGVLLSGLEKQPGYTSARVSLGKIYIEKGMVKEAKSEFENVIKVIPDNLYAHKKLAEIYRDAGDREIAIKAFRTVLKLNAMDEDALMNLNELEGETVKPVPVKETPVQAVPAPEEVPVEEPLVPQEAPVEPVHEDAGFHEAGVPVSEAAEAHSEEDLESFKNAIFGGQREEGTPPAQAAAGEKLDFEVPGEKTVSEKTAPVDVTGEAVGEITIEEPAAALDEISLEVASEEEVGGISVEEPAEEAADEFSLEEPAEEEVGGISLEEPAAALDEISLEVASEEEVGGISVEEPAEEAADGFSLGEPAVEAVDEISFDDVQAALGQGETEAPSMPEFALREEVEETIPPGWQQRAEPVEEPRPAAGAAIEDAEKMIAGGNFGGALGIYQNILARNPDDRKTLQRVEELRALLKMMGKDKEVLIEKLNNFMENIKKRRDEFLRSS